MSKEGDMGLSLFFFFHSLFSFIFLAFVLSCPPWMHPEILCWLEWNSMESKQHCPTRLRPGPLHCAHGRTNRNAYMSCTRLLCCQLAVPAADRQEQESKTLLIPLHSQKTHKWTVCIEESRWQEALAAGPGSVRWTTWKHHLKLLFTWMISLGKKQKTKEQLSPWTGT